MNLIIKNTLNILFFYILLNTNIISTNPPFQNIIYSSTLVVEAKENSSYQVEQKIEENFPVVINECMASNTNTIQDPQGEYDDWVELYNKGTENIDLSGLYLSDKVDNIKKWKFPDKTIIKSGEYLIIWCDENSKATPGIHTNFKLSADGEVILLVNSDEKGNSILDSISFGKQEPDISFGRYPNASGRFYFMNPTPGRSNDNVLTSINQVFSSYNINVVVYPNPFDNIIYFDIQSNSSESYRLEIFNSQGTKVRMLQEQIINNLPYKVLWDGRNDNGAIVPEGLYFIKINSEHSFVIIPIIKY